MAGLALQPHVGFGLVAGRPIFLDLRRDRYFALDRGAEQGFLEAAQAGPTSRPFLDRLLATGLFRAEDSPAPILPASILPAQASLLDLPRGHAGIGGVLRAYASTARANRRLAREPLLAVLSSGPATEADAQATEAVARISQSFLAARSLVPIAPRCLPDSLALREWLHQAGVRPALIFGVRLDPFGAHCWLQSGATVLNDAVDRVGAFTPVLALE
jgi:hypothetical protein